MRKVFRIREIAPHDGMNSQDVEVMRGDASRVNILHLRTRLQVGT